MLNSMTNKSLTLYNARFISSEKIRANDIFFKVYIYSLFGKTNFTV